LAILQRAQRNTTARPLIRRETLTEFRDRMTGWVLREIDTVFAAAEIPLAASTDVDAKVGARRSQVERYYASLDLTTAEDVRKLLQVFESVLASTRRDFSPALHWLEKDGYVYRDGRIRRRGSRVMPNVAKKLASGAAIRDDVRRIEESVDKDPARAISSSKKLIESVCKRILEAKQLPFSKTAELSELIKAATKALKIEPDDIPSAAEGGDLFKRTLNNLAAIAGSIAALQALYGSGPRKGAKAKGLQPSYARLVAGATSVLVNFLWDTFENT
jgi:Abortive infection C-terminus